MQFGFYVTDPISINHKSSRVRLLKKNSEADGRGLLKYYPFAASKRFGREFNGYGFSVFLGLSKKASR